VIAAEGDQPETDPVVAGGALLPALPHPGVSSSLSVTLGRRRGGSSSLSSLSLMFVLLGGCRARGSVRFWFISARRGIFRVFWTAFETRNSYRLTRPAAEAKIQ